MALSILIFITLFSMMRFQSAEENENCHPTQIHISFGDIYYSVSQDPAVETNQSALINNNQAYLVWHTIDTSCTFAITIQDPQTSVTVSTISAAYYADFFYDFAAPDAAISSYTTNNGTYSTVAYTALFKGLEYEKKYSYTISDLISGASEGPFVFRLPTPYLKNASRKIFLAGDLDAFDNGMQTINVFKNLSETAYDEYGSWIMMGDAGYDVETENGTRGDAYFQAVQSYSTRWLQTMALGNHDIYANWSFMNLRIRNPLFNMTKNHYFSYNQEGMHFTFLNLDYYDRASTAIQQEMISWIDNDLKVANTPENRAKWPWVIFVSHRPIYCGYVEQGEQDIPESAWCYSFYAKRKTWDELLHKHSVDLALTAHKHSYERMGPIYQNKSATFTKVDNDPLSHNIIDPQATVFIMEGSGGNVWYTPEAYDPEGWAIVADVKPGYGVFHVQINTGNWTLAYEHYNSVTGNRIDYMNLVKTRPPVPGTDDDDGISGWTIAIIVLIIGTIIGFGYNFWKKRQEDKEDEYRRDNSKDVPLIELRR